MCLIIAKPKGIRLTKKVLKHGWKENSHQAGFAYAANGHVFFRKNFRSFSSFWREYRKLQAKDEVPATLIHFRLTSGSSISFKNCHPFYITPELAFAHNGTIHDLNYSDTVSDTRRLVNFLIKPTSKYKTDFYKSKSFQWLLCKAVGDNNKLVFLDKNGEFIIINGEKGEKEDGVWYSNETFKKPRPPKKVTNVTINNTTNSSTSVDNEISVDNKTVVNYKPILKPYKAENSAFLY